MCPNMYIQSLPLMYTHQGHYCLSSSSGKNYSLLVGEQTMQVYVQGAIDVIFYALP